MVRLRAVAAVVLWAALDLHAATQRALPDGYTRRVWQTQDGLPENTVQAFAQTPDNYLWIGTSGGLVRFDGAGFVVYDRDNTPAMRSAGMSARRRILRALPNSKTSAQFPQPFRRPTTSSTSRAAKPPSTRTATCRKIITT